MTTSPQILSARRIWLGRAREVGELEAGLDDLVAGRGGLFLVTGEPGIGKTRLCDELSRAAATRGVAVHWGRAWEAGGAPSYWLFTQVLRSMCKGLNADPLVEMMGAPGSDRFRLFDAVTTFMRAAAVKAPQVVVLDDLHAADPSSLQLLHFLVRDLRSAPLLVVATYRDAEARLAPEIGRTLAQIAREACMLPLRRLDRREVEDFVAQATGAAPTSDRVEAIHQRTEGNPLFLRELLQLHAPAAREPEGIREVVRARLSLLTPGVRRALEVAAVFGRELEIEAHAAVANAAGIELSEWIAEASDAGIIEALELPSRWRFTHVLLREGLYDDLPSAQRAALHRAAADELRERAGEPRLAELAYHLLHAISVAGVEAAADAALRAAEQAMRVLAFEDACAVLARIRKPLEDAPREERRLFEVMLALGIARIRAGDVKSGKETCLRATEHARRLGDGELFARAVLGSACEFVWGVRDLALVALLDEALATLPSGDGALRARCMAQLAAERQPEPDTRGPVDLARAAVAMARRVGDVATLRFTLTNAGLAMLVFAPPSERMPLNQECLRLALAADDKLLALRSHLLLSADFLELGDMTGRAAHIRAYEDLLELRHDGFRWMTLGMRAWDALSEARFDDAERLFHEASEVHRVDEGRGAEMVAFPVGFARAAERYDDLPGIESRVRAAFGSNGEDLGSCVGEMLIAQLHGRGDRQRAAAQLATVRAHPLFAEITEASWLGLLVDACHLLGDVALAEKLYPALLPRADRIFWLGPMSMHCEPPYSRLLGLLAQTLGRLDEAVAHLAAAEIRVVGIDLRSDLARVRYELAGVLLARGAAGDRERASTLLEGAHALATKLGQTNLLPLLSARIAEARSASPSLPAREDAQHAITRAAPPFAVRREGEYWTISSGARTLRLRDSRGMRVLAQLVTNPGQEFHVLQLVSSGEDAGKLADRGDAGTVLDADAVQSYRRRLLELREELEEAEGFADAGRTDRARTEIDFLTQELARAMGLGGRERRAGSAAERARTAVQKRVRDVIRRIWDGLPELGKHLDQNIRTGTFCGYLPEGRANSRRT